MAALRREFPEAKKRKCHEKGQNLKKDSQEYSNFQKPPPSPPPPPSSRLPHLSKFLMIYHKIPKISPAAYIF